MNKTGPTRYMRNPHAVLREEFDDWAVLFNPDTGNAVGVNPVGVAVWKLLDGNRDLGAIIAGIRNQFENIPEALEDEILKYLRNLAEHGFIGLDAESFER